MNAQRNSQRRHLIGVLALLSQQDYNNGRLAAALPPGLAQAMGIVPKPTQRLEELCDTKVTSKVMEEIEQHEVEMPHDHDCNGECGPLWFFGTLADHIIDLMATDEQKVNSLLAEMGHNVLEDGDEQHN
jgi:hypothetical protein